jgi:hypothetical protein
LCSETGQFRRGLGRTDVERRAWSSSFDKLRMRTIVQAVALENLILSLSKDGVFGSRAED